MDVSFRTRELLRCFEDERLAQRTWGPNVGRSYVRRVITIQEASSLDRLFAIASLRLHRLSGDRRGYYSLTLAGRWRLVIATEGDSVSIEEVTNHYDD